VAAFLFEPSISACAGSECCTVGAIRVKIGGNCFTFYEQGLGELMDYDLGYFDLDTRVLEPLDNPFGPKM